MARALPTTDSLESLEVQLGHRFRNRELLLQALTHRSHLNREAGGLDLDNERFEFLGDSIVGFVVSDALCQWLPTLREGQLSRIKSNLVSSRSLAQVAERLGLGRHLRLGSGEEKTGGRHKQALLANAVEALVAALYCDGGLEPARDFVERYLLEPVRRGRIEPLVRADFKSALQEYLQGRRLPPARYETVETTGPEHRKMFTIELWVGEERWARGQGASKKAAELQAARAAMERLLAEVEGETR